MPTIMTHPVPLIAAAAAFGNHVISTRLLIAGIFFAILPDVDAISFKLGIPYESIFGHRGLSHSIAMVAIAFLIGLLFAPLLKARRMIAALVLSGAVLTHIALDAMTSGGLGVAFFWPFDNTRHFVDFRPIRVSPISMKAFLTDRGIAVLKSELLWVWLPCISMGLFGFCIRHFLIKKDPFANWKP